MLQKFGDQSLQLRAWFQYSLCVVNAQVWFWKEFWRNNIVVFPALYSLFV